jgi:hypothetical protein
MAARAAVTAVTTTAKNGGDSGDIDAATAADTDTDNNQLKRQQKKRRWLRLRLRLRWWRWKRQKRWLGAWRRQRLKAEAIIVEIVDAKVSAAAALTPWLRFVCFLLVGVRREEGLL